MVMVCKWQYTLCNRALTQVENIAIEGRGNPQLHNNYWSVMGGGGWLNGKIGAQNDGKCHHF